MARLFVFDHVAAFPFSIVPLGENRSARRREIGNAVTLGSGKGRCSAGTGCQLDLVECWVALRILHHSTPRHVAA